MLVHGAGERGRAAVVCELPLKAGELGDRGTVAAELDGDGGLEQAGVAECLVGLGDEGAVDVVARGVLGEPWADGHRARDERAGGGVVVGVCAPSAERNICGHVSSVRPASSRIQSTIVTCLVQILNYPGPTDAATMRHARLRQLLPRGDGERDHRRPVEPAHHSGAGPWEHPVQRHREGDARDLAVPARAAAAAPREEGRPRDVAVGDRPGQRVPPHAGRAGLRRVVDSSAAGPSSGSSTTCARRTCLRRR